MAQQDDHDLVRGDTWKYRIERRGFNKRCLDISGYTYACEWRLDPTAPGPAEETATVDLTNGASGYVTLMVDDVTTAALVPGTVYFYDIQETDDLGNVTTLVSGKITILVDVTQ